MEKQYEEWLRRWGSLLRPDLYGPFKLLRQPRWDTAQEQLVAVVKWEMDVAGLVPPEVSE